MPIIIITMIIIQEHLSLCVESCVLAIFKVGTHDGT